MQREDEHLPIYAAMYCKSIWLQLAVSVNMPDVVWSLTEYGSYLVTLCINIEAVTE